METAKVGGFSRKIVAVLVAVVLLFGGAIAIVGIQTLAPQRAYAASKANVTAQKAMMKQMKVLAKTSKSPKNLHYVFVDLDGDKVDEAIFYFSFKPEVAPGKFADRNNYACIAYYKGGKAKTTVLDKIGYPITKKADINFAVYAKSRSIKMYGKSDTSESVRWFEFNKRLDKVTYTSFFKYLDENTGEDHASYEVRNKFGATEKAYKKALKTLAKGDAAELGRCAKWKTLKI